MYINDNIAALNAWRNLTATGNSMTTVLEHLSSGLRINKAADDAAGLAISQKMLAQINGLDQATRNAQDGISLVQTAEGAMGQGQDILQRMRQLAVQATSDTETTADRQQLQIEMDQLAQQLTDIANNTEFNTKRVLTGEFKSGNTTLAIQVGANAGQDLSFNIGAVDAKSLGVSRDVVSSAAETVAASQTTGGGLAGYTPPGTLVAVGANLSVSPTNNLALGAGKYKLVYTATLNASGVITGATLQLQDAGTSTNIGAAVNVTAYNTAKTGIVVGDANAGLSFTVDFAGNDAVTGSVNGTKSGVTAGGTVTQADTIGTAGTAAASGSAANGWKATAVGGLYIGTKSDASSALATIDDAINTISANRATLGATQNRLQYVINGLQITSQNLSEAKARITDTDMAKEMAEFTKQQILQQAGVAMLAQANAMPQSVLKLLG